MGIIIKIKIYSVLFYIKTSGVSVGSRSKLISERSDGFGIGDLAIVSEEHEKGDSLSDEADDEEEMVSY